MKILLSLILLLSYTTVIHAATPVLSLEKQMQRQNLINKKNAIAEKQAQLLAKKKANQDRLIALKYQKYKPKTTTQVIAAIPASTPTQGQKTPISIASNSTNTVSHTPSNITNVDINRVRSTWLSWYNDLRTSKGLGIYTYDSRLDSTAHDWNIVFAESRGSNFHERSPGDGYYNYPIINEWFRSRGVIPQVIGGVTHSENVSYGYYTCNKSDCTDDLINSIRSSYIFFINSAVHSKSVLQPNFTKIGLDIIVVPSERRYYVTVHYMTK